MKTLKMSKLAIPEVLKEKNGRVLWTKESLGFTPVQKVQKLFDDNGVKGRVSGVKGRVSGVRFYSFVTYECLRCCNVCEQQVLSLINGHTCKYCSRLKAAELIKGKTFKVNRITTHKEAQTFLDTYANGKFKFLGFERNKWSKLLIVVTCEVCGIENCKTVKDWKSGQRCANCVKASRTFTKERFVEVANKVHNGLYSYDNFDYVNSSTKGQITCSAHGDFEQTPDNHIYNKQGCPKCKNSKGELMVSKVLTTLGVDFKSQKTFNECRNKNLLRFDFLIPEYGIIIEWHGEQHFKFVEVFHGTLEGFEEAKRIDLIKKEFAEVKGFIFIELDCRKFSKNGHPDENKTLKYLRRKFREIKNGEWDNDRKSEGWRTLILEESEILGK